MHFQAGEGEGPLEVRRKKRKLLDSLTQHLSDSKILAFKPRASQRRAYGMSASAEKIALSVVTLIVLVLAGGHLFGAW